MKRNILLGAALSIFGVGIAAVAVSAVDISPAAGPATQPAGNTDALIRQLGNDDFHLRQDAARQLKAMGKQAVPALKEARKSPDPEIHARAEELLQEIDRPPAATVPQPGGAFSGKSSLRVSIMNGVKTVDVDEPGRTIHIDEGKDGIAMKVAGQIDGKDVTRDFTAKNADELKRDNPDAFALYQRYAGQGGMVLGGGAVVINGNVRLNIQGGPGGGIILQPGGAIIGPVIPPVGNLPPPPVPVQPRLGISAAEEKMPGDGLTVLQVEPGSRAEKIGLKEQDKIQKVNGQEIHSTDDLRKSIAENPKGLVIQGSRDGKAIKLDEKGE